MKERWISSSITSSKTLRIDPMPLSALKEMEQQQVAIEWINFRPNGIPMVNLSDWNWSRVVGNWDWNEVGGL